MSDEYIKKDDAIAYCNKKANYYADKAERYKKYQEHGSYFDLASRIQSYETEATFYSSFSEELESLPTADVVERKRGEWIYGEHDVAMCDGYRCDKCGFFVPWDYEHKFIDFINDYHFCPNCGAQMKTADNERDYERAIEQMQHDMLYESTYNSEDGSM